MRGRGAFLLFAAVACSSNAERTGAIDVARAHPELAVRLSRAVEPTTQRQDGRLSRTLRVDLPARANAPVRLSTLGRDGAWITLTPIGVADRAANLQSHARVFTAIARSTDAIQTFEPGRFEELRILHREGAPTTHRWVIDKGPDVVELRVRERLVEALDRGGRVLFVQHPPFAIDAAGTRREADVTLDGATVTVSLDPSGLAYPIALDPTWSVVAPTLTAHVWGGAALLPDGRVMVAGGRRVSATIPPNTTAEIYDPSKNTWTAAGTLPANPVGFAGSLSVLPGGKAILVGNRIVGSDQTALWNGTTWSAGPSMANVRTNFGSATFADGRVLVVGGTVGGVGISTGEVYDPVANTWTNTGPMAEAKTGLLPARLKDGRMFIAGGSQLDATTGSTVAVYSTAETLDPSTLKWTKTTAMPETRDSPFSYVRADGDVEVIEGYFLSGASESIIFNHRRFHVATGVWDVAKPVTLSLAIILPLSDGRVLFPSSTDAVVYDPTTDAFLFAGETSTNIVNRAYVPLADGRALEIGGRMFSGGTFTPTTEVDMWSQAGLGAACTTDYDCISAHCTDGVCCSVATCGTGKTCAATGALGTCKTLVGFACAAASDCKSGFCADGVCCDRACTGQCKACDDPFALGTCKAIAGAPHGTRTACSDGGGDACKATTCNGTDATACHVPTGTTVACGSNTCNAATGTEQHVGTCSAGVCVATSKSCGAYACGATACKTACSASSDCAPGYWCSGATCVPTLGLGKACSDASACDAKLTCVDGVCCGSASCPAGGSCALPGHEGSCSLKLGAACTVDAACASGHCVDSVCCESTCDGQCEACDAKGSEGTCAAVSGAPHGARAACASDAADPCKSAACDGSTRTSCGGLAGSDVSCQPQRCEGGTLTPAAVCDGKGNCAKGTTATCSGFTCVDATSCRTTCKDDGDCVDGFHCDAGKCTAITATCSSDGSQVLPTGGSPVACAPFVCRAGACLTACATSNDCATGTLCSFATKTCVNTSEAAPADEGSGGCSTGRGRTVGVEGIVAFLAAAFFARRRAQTIVASALLASGCSRERPADKRATSHLELVRAASPRLARFGLEVKSQALDVRLPERVDAPLHLVDVRDPSFAIDVWDEDARAAESARAEAARVHRGALPFTTILHAEIADGAEEVRVLDDPRAPTTMHLRLSGSPSVASLRVREGRIEALDDTGRVRIASAPMWAVDARGTRRDLSLRALPGDALHVVATLDARDLAFPVVIDPVWTSTPSMKYARYYHTATVLADGRVLVVGGQNDDATATVSVAKSAEIYDPATNTWTSTASMSVAHEFHAAARAGSLVVVAGGIDPSTGAALSDAEVWDPATSTWTHTTMPEKRRDPLAASLPGGKALVFAGTPSDNGAAAVATLKTFIFDATSKSWTPSGDLGLARSDASSVALADGTVFLIGGQPPSAVATTSVEKYDASTGKWSAVAATSLGRLRAAAVAFSSDKKLLVAGGGDGGAFPGFSTTEIYDVTSNTWTAGPLLGTTIAQPMAVTLSGGRVLVAGGESHFMPIDAWQLFDPATSTFVARGKMPFARSNAAFVPLAANAALLAGGTGGTPGEFAGRSDALVFAPQANGGTCTSGLECKSGFCTEGVCCAVASCGAGSTCAGSASPGVCTKRNAVSCTTSSECASGFCVDSVCCESACSGQCAACDVPGNVGKCRPVRGAPHGSRTACAATPTECGPTCDGTDTVACHPRASGTACGGATCSAGSETHPSTCDGAGACKDTSTSCGAYACGATACKTSCATSADCATGYACSGTTCVPLPGKGSDCSTTGACGPGLSCVAGVCCGSASCSSDSVCPLGVGDCVKVDGASCSTNAECQHGHCVDGFCCNEACDGACGACDVPGKEGHCVAVRGKPHGARSCPSDAADPCSASSCNGADKSTCAAKAGADVMCRAATCADGKATTSAFCDGSGACPALVTSDCGAYKCNADGTACRTRCTSATDCANNAWCNAGKCETLAGTCSSDGSSLEIAGGGSVSCSPFVCRDNGCLSSCESSGDCGEGNVCDVASKSCVAPPQSDDASGCAFHPTVGRGTFALALLGALGLLRRRSCRPTR